MSGLSIFHALESARAECERRMAELGEGKRGGEIPREWFALNVLERRLRPLVYEAGRIEGIGHFELRAAAGADTEPDA